MAVIIATCNHNVTISRELIQGLRHGTAAVQRAPRRFANQLAIDGTILDVDGFDF